MSSKLNTAIAVAGIDIGKNSFHVIGLDKRGAIVLRQKWSRGQVEARLANTPPCLIGMEACVGAHHLSRKLQALGHDARLMPAKYVRPYSCLSVAPCSDPSRRGLATLEQEAKQTRRPALTAPCAWRASTCAGRDEGTGFRHEQRNCIKIRSDR